MMLNKQNICIDVEYNEDTTTIIVNGIEKVFHTKGLKKLTELQIIAIVHKHFEQFRKYVKPYNNMVPKFVNNVISVFEPNVIVKISDLKIEQPKKRSWKDFESDCKSIVVLSTRN